MSSVLLNTSPQREPTGRLQRFLPAIQAFTARLQVKGLPRLLWTVRHLFTRPDATYRIHGDVRVRIDNDIVYQWWNVVNYGGYETILMLERLLKPGDTYVDVGANIGFMTINAARIIGPRGCVLAVEPDPRVRRKLTGNIHLNEIKNVQVVAEALGDQEGVARFSVATEEGLSRLDHGRGENPCMVLLESVQVPVTTLDRLLERLVPGRAVRLVKIDVEGSEQAVFSGARNLLQRQETMFIFENNYGALAQNGLSLVDISDVLTAAKYDLYSVNSHSADWLRLGRFPTFTFIGDAAPIAKRNMDVLAIPHALRGHLGVSLGSGVRSHGTN